MKPPRIDFLSLSSPPFFREYHTLAPTRLVSRKISSLLIFYPCRQDRFREHAIAKVAPTVTNLGALVPVLLPA